MTYQLSIIDHSNLIQKCIDGDVAAQKNLYGLYMPAMYNRAIRMLGNKEDAKDIIQEVFTIVFRDIEKFRGEATLGAWIKRITINSCLNYIKVQKKHFTVALDDYQSKVLVEENATTFDVKKIHLAITKLPEGCRTIFNLYQMEGYQHQEIAQILNISESTSKSQYKRAKALLRKLLKNSTI